MEFQDDNRIRIKCGVDACPVRLLVRRPDANSEHQHRATIDDLDLDHQHGGWDMATAPPGFDEGRHVMRRYEASLYLHRPALAHLREALNTATNPAKDSVQQFFQDFCRSQTTSDCLESFARQLTGEKFPDEVVKVRTASILWYAAKAEPVGCSASAG